MRKFVAFLLYALTAAVSQGQHLWWDLKGENNGTCLYGEVTVWDTSTTIYYCGANWHPGEPAGGYCGIQHNSDTQRVTIFSIWDTTPSLHPSVTYADINTKYSRFGGEGEGSHTHMDWPWKVGETFHFFIRKRPGEQPGTTDCAYYVWKPDQRKWLHEATITSPNGSESSVQTVGGSIASFLENWSGQKRDLAKLATYNLWLGVDPQHMKRLTHSGGDGKWGQLGDAYCLAEGTDGNLAAAISDLPTRAGKMIWGEGPELKDRPIPKQFLPLP